MLFFPTFILQLISWFIYIYLNISFHLFIGCQNSSLFMFLNAIHVFLSVMMFSSGYTATNANVVDPYIAERGFPEAVMTITSFQKLHSKELKQQKLYWCKYCQWYVTKNAKHCRSCNRCTNKFDHHCRWFNNCIAEQNYKAFFFAICASGKYLKTVQTHIF